MSRTCIEARDLGMSQIITRQPLASPRDSAAHSPVRCMARAAQHRYLTNRLAMGRIGGHQTSVTCQKPFGGESRGG